MILNKECTNCGELEGRSQIACSNCGGPLVPLQAPEPPPRPGIKKGASLRKAINDKCKDCIYDPVGKGNWRQQVTDCRSFDCGLYPVRPISKPRKEKSDA